MVKIHFALGVLVPCRDGDVHRKMRIFVKRSILEMDQVACFFAVSMDTEAKT